MGNGEREHSCEISELLLLIKRGSSGAFVKLAEMYAPLLEGEVLRYNGSLSSADMDDLRQGAMVSLYRAALAYREDKGVTFGLFAKICIVNGIADTLRYVGKKQNNISMDMLDEDDISEGDADPEELVLGKEQLDGLKNRIRMLLSDMEYRIFELYIGGYSYREISGFLGLSKKSVDNALRRLKEKLKKTL